MERIAQDVERAVAEVRNEISAAIIESVAQLTPVDTGLARTNWRLGIGYSPVAILRRPWSPIPSRYRPPYPPGGNRSERANLNAVVSAAVSRLTADNSLRPVYITNNIPYIGRLNEGYSRQSPAGFVRVGIATGVRVGVSRVRFELNGD